MKMKVWKTKNTVVEVVVVVVVVIFIFVGLASS